jgi:hypothetical protein
MEIVAKIRVGPFASGHWVIDVRAPKPRSCEN